MKKVSQFVSIFSPWRLFTRLSDILAITLPKISNNTAVPKSSLYQISLQFLKLEKMANVYSKTSNSLKENVFIDLDSLSQFLYAYYKQKCGYLQCYSQAQLIPVKKPFR